MSKKSRANKAAAAAQTETPATETNETATVETTETTAANETPTTDATAQTAAPAAEEKKKKIPMARVFNADGSVALLTKGVESVKRYVKGFMSLAVGARKGYDNYWAKEDGFTNPESIMKLTPQGIGKMMAILQHRAALYIADGGELGSEMQDVLTGVREYESVAVSEAKSVAEAKAIEEALATVAKARGCSIDEARKFMAAFAATPPATRAAVVESEPTIGETGATVDQTEESEVHA